MASKLWDVYIVDGSDRKVNVQMGIVQGIKEGMQASKLSENLFNKVRSMRACPSSGL